MDPAEDADFDALAALLGEPAGPVEGDADDALALAEGILNAPEAKERLGFEKGSRASTAYARKCKEAKVQGDKIRDLTEQAKRLNERRVVGPLGGHC